MGGAASLKPSSDLELQASAKSRTLLPFMASMFLIGSAEVLAGPMMVEMGAHFGVASALIAWFPASYALTYAILAPLLGPVSDRFGRKSLLVPGLVGLALALLVVAAAPRFSVALTASAFAGSCAAAIQPNALAIVNDSVAPERMAAAIGRVFMGLTLSFVLVPPLSGVLAARVDWRAAYVVIAALALTTAILALRAHVPARVASARLGFARSFSEALALHGVRRRLAASFLWLGLSIGVSTILPEIVRRRYALSTEVIGILAGIYGLSTVLGNALSGCAARHGARRVLAVGVSASILGCFVVGVVPAVPGIVAVLAGVLWAVGYGAAGPTHHTALSGLSERVRGTVTALHASLLNLGIMVVAFAAGRFFDPVGVEIVVGVTTVFMLIGLALLLSIRSEPAPV